MSRVNGSTHRGVVVIIILQHTLDRFRNLGPVNCQAPGQRGISWLLDNLTEWRLDEEVWKEVRLGGKLTGQMGHVRCATWSWLMLCRKKRPIWEALVGSHAYDRHEGVPSLRADDLRSLQRRAGRTIPLCGNGG